MLNKLKSDTNSKGYNTDWLEKCVLYFNMVVVTTMAGGFIPPLLYIVANDLRQRYFNMETLPYTYQEAWIVGGITATITCIIISYVAYTYIIPERQVDEIK